MVGGPRRTRKDSNVTLPSLNRRTPALILAAFVLALTFATPLALGRGHHRSPAALDSVERAIAHRINSYRHRHGLRPLRLDNRMNVGANQHSRSMARGHYFAHNSANGSAWDARVRHYSRANFVGEVICWTEQTTPAQQARVVVSAWVHSGPHRAALLTRGFSRVGVARWRGGARTYFTADLAGRRR
jgi:uncharacterized protein YkwD